VRFSLLKNNRVHSAHKTKYVSARPLAIFSPMTHLSRGFVRAARWTVLAGATYTAVVRYTEPDPPASDEFRVGTVGKYCNVPNIRAHYRADDIIMDSLKTGDIILFDRPWVLKHVRTILPLSLASLMT
jgi:hypothetical protein